MSVNSKMTALAYEIRELSGTTGTMGLDAMKNHIDDANTDVATEADLIEQIASALEGKAAGGGTSVEICTVTIDNVDNIAYVGIDDNGNAIYCQSINNDGNTLSVNIVKGTIFCVQYENTVMIQNYTSGIADSIGYDMSLRAYYLKSEAANTEVITIMVD